MRGKKSSLLTIVVAVLGIVSVHASATCSASAIASWHAKCASRTAGNRDFLPLAGDIGAEVGAIDETNLADTYKQARVTALKLSAAAGKSAMSGMRTKSDAWYKSSLRKMLTFVCDQISTSADYDRCVNTSSEFAERDLDGKCVQLYDDNACATRGMCERQSNCRWDNAIADASFRREMFVSANITTAKKWMEQDYPSSFAAFLAPGIVFAVLTSVACVGFVALRCVFNQCGGRNPREKGYTRCDLLIPAVVFITCSLAVFICALITIAQNSNISDGVSSVLSSLNVTLENIDIFADNIKRPLVDAEANRQLAHAAVVAQLEDSDWISADLKTLQSMINDFGAIFSAQGKFPFASCEALGEACVSCSNDICVAPVNTFVANAQQALTGSGGVVQSAVALLQDTFVQRNANLSMSLRNATLQITNIALLTNRSKEAVHVITKTFDDYSFSRTALVLSVFIIGVFASFLGLFAIFKGVCTKKSAWVHLLHVSWLLNVLVCILGFILSASLLAVGALWYDSCNYMNILHDNLTPYFPTRMSEVVGTCFNDSSIFKPLNLEESLVFQCDLDDINATLAQVDLTALPTTINTYGEIVSNYGLVDFGFDPTTSRTLMIAASAAANAAAKEASTKPPSGAFTSTSILTPWLLYSEVAPSSCSSSTADAVPICYMAAKCAGNALYNSTFASAYWYAASFAKITTMLTGMQENLLGNTGESFSPTWSYPVSIAEFATSYFDRLAAFETAKLKVLLQQEVGSVLANVENARCTESCGWINISFNAVHDAMCNDILGTTLGISLCVLFLCLFLIPMIVTGITLQKRLRGATKGTYEELELRLKAMEAKQREDARAKAANGSGASKGIDLASFFKKNLTSV